MKYTQSNTAAGTLITLGFTALASQGAVIFGAAENGDFFGNDNTALPAAQTAGSAFDGNRWNGGTRRASTGPEFFVGNWIIDPTGFGGVDQVAGSGDPGLLTNDNVSLVATAYLNDGSNGATPPTGTGGGGSGQGDQTDDTQPSGAFTTTVLSGETINFSFEAISNGNGGLLPIGYAITLVNINGGATPDFQIVSSTYTPTAANVYEVVTGMSAAVPADFNSYNVQVNLINPAAGNDQIGLDDIVLTTIPEPSTGLLSLVALGFFARRKR